MRPMSKGGASCVVAGPRRDGYGNYCLEKLATICLVSSDPDVGELRIRITSCKG